MKMILRIFAVLMFTVLLASCGGGGGGVAPVSGAPSISNLQYSPTGAYLNSGEGTATINGSFDFADPNGNIVSLTISAFNANGVMIDTQTSTIIGVAGSLLGTIEISGAADTTVLGNFTLQVYVTDSAGLRSNILSGTFNVSDTPWKNKAPKPTAGTGSAAALNGIIYHIYGEYDVVTGNSLTIFESYNPVTDSWTSRTTLPSSGFVTVAAVNGKLYGIGGGYVLTGGGTGVEEYDPLTDSWTPKAPMPTGRTGCSASVVNGKIYVIGGYSAGFLSTVEVYDPLTNSWSTSAPMPTPRSALTTSVANGKIYAIGGENLSGNIGLQTVEEYDPITNLWSSKAPQPWPPLRGIVSGTINNKIYVTGGLHFSAGLQNTTLEYDPLANTWKWKTGMPTGVAFPATAVVNNRMYVISSSPGYGGTVTYEYTPANDLL